jgi:hypothetical protein
MHATQESKGDAMKKGKEGYVTFDWPTRTVCYDGKILRPNRSQAICNHSPTGFNWSYGGSGPAQLELAIMLRATGDRRRAFQLYQRFKWKFIATLPRQGCELEIAKIKAWLAERAKDED